MGVGSVVDVDSGVGGTISVSIFIMQLKIQFIHNIKKGIKADPRKKYQNKTNKRPTTPQKDKNPLTGPGHHQAFLSGSCGPFIEFSNLMSSFLTPFSALS